MAVWSDLTIILIGKKRGARIRNFLILSVSNLGHSKGCLEMGVSLDYSLPFLTYLSMSHLSSLAVDYLLSPSPLHCLMWPIPFFISFGLISLKWNLLVWSCCSVTVRIQSVIVKSDHSGLCKKREIFRLTNCARTDLRGALKWSQKMGKGLAPLLVLGSSPAVAAGLWSGFVRLRNKCCSLK